MLAVWIDEGRSSAPRVFQSPIVYNILIAHSWAISVAYGLESL